MARQRMSRAWSDLAHEAWRHGSPLRYGEIAVIELARLGYAAGVSTKAMLRALADCKAPAGCSFQVVES